MANDHANRSQPLKLWLACLLMITYLKHIEHEFIMIPQNSCRHHQHVKMCFYGYTVRVIYKPIMTFIAYGNSSKIMPLGVTWLEQISGLIDRPPTMQPAGIEYFSSSLCYAIKNLSFSQLNWSTWKSASCHFLEEMTQAVQHNTFTQLNHNHNKSRWVCEFYGQLQMWHTESTPEQLSSLLDIKIQLVTH